MSGYATAAEAREHAVLVELEALGVDPATVDLDAFADRVVSSFEYLDEAGEACTAFEVSRPQEELAAAARECTR